MRRSVSFAHSAPRNEEQLTFVTLSVARSSLSYFPPIFSPSPPPLFPGAMYLPPTPPGPLPAPVPTTSAIGSATDPSAGGSPSGAIVPLKGHRAVKCSPLQIRHLTVVFFSSIFFLSCSLSAPPWALASSRSTLLKPCRGYSWMSSPTEVVSLCGPAGSLAAAPNLAQPRRSAMRGFTRWETRVFLMVRTVRIFLPSESRRR